MFWSGGSVTWAFLTWWSWIISCRPLCRTSVRSHCLLWLCRFCSVCRKHQQKHRWSYFSGWNPNIMFDLAVCFEESTEAETFSSSAFSEAVRPVLSMCCARRTSSLQNRGFWVRSSSVTSHRGKEARTVKRKPNKSSQKTGIYNTTIWIVQWNTFGIRHVTFF